MAKKAKTDRQKVIDDVRKTQKRAERRRGFLIIGVCAAVAILIIGAAAFRPMQTWWELRAYSDASLSEIGAPASECGKIKTKPAKGSAGHVEPQQVDYQDAPPAFGDHWNIQGQAPAPMSKKFWTESDRPELEALVHNLEHGYTIVWYDETIAADDEALTELQAVGKKFPGEEDFRYKFYAAPWTSEDGKSFPKGQHIAFTHWSKGGVSAPAPDPQQPQTQQQGVWQYCPEFSGEALSEFMLEYPYMDSPEPGAM